jgi:type I restriction enzyme S subunit
MSKWETKRLGDVAIIIAGGTPTTSITDYWDGDVSWITPNDLSNHSERFISKGERCITDKGLNKSAAKILPANTVLLSTRAPIGYLAIAANEVSTNQGFKNLVCDEKQVNYMFLFYYLKQNVETLKSFATGATFPELSGGTLKKIKAQFPDLPTQTRIADILSAYDDAIENNNRRIALLEKAAQELYREWFVRFRFPGHESAKFVNGLPEGWEVKRLEKYCTITDGTHDTPKPTDTGVPLVTGRCIKDGFVDFDSAYLISKDDHKDISRRSGLHSGDILFSNIGTVGSTCIVEYSREFSVKNVIIFKPKTQEETAYLYYLLTNPTIQSIFAAQTNGASQQFVGLTFMRRFKIIVPSKPIQKQFSDYVSSILRKKQVLHSQSQNLARQRDLLLPRLMSGRLEV